MLSGELTGVGRYVFEILERVARHFSNAQFIIYSPSEVHRFENSPNCTYRTDASPLGRRLKPVAWSLFRAGAMANRDDVDLFWGPCHFLPLNLKPSVVKILTVHDLVYKVCPETMTIYQRISHNLFFARCLRSVHYVIANSEGTSKRLGKMFGREADGIARPGISSEWNRANEICINNLRMKYGIEGKYLLAVSTIEPRKNYDVLVNAFLSLRLAGMIDDYSLVIVGRPGWKCRESVDLIQRSASQGVIWLGYFPAVDLPALYSGADLFICPSVYEGFGIPAAEARGCGVSSLLADIPELHEAGGQAARYCAPTSEALRHEIVRCLRPGTTRLGQDSEECDIPTWQVAAATYIDLFSRSLQQ
jgi:glycosyltransferase involved in cell wall biosynthesis